MAYFLLTFSYLLDIILLILVFIFVLYISQLINTLGKEYKFIEKLKITPRLIIAKPINTFSKHAPKNNAGTFLASFYQHQKLTKQIKRILQGALGFLAIKLVIVSLIFLNIPRPGEAQPTPNMHYLANNYEIITKGKSTFTQWDNDGLNLQAGQYAGNYISPIIGDGKSYNLWQTLSWQTDRVYNKRPEYPLGTLAVWPMDSLENCADVNSRSYNCQLNKVALANGLYNSKAYYFNGLDSKAKINKTISFKDSFTIGAWVKFDKLIINRSEDKNFVIFAKGYGDYTAANPYDLRYSIFFGIKKGSLELSYWSDDNKDHWVTARETNFNFEAGRWYYLAGIYDSKNKTIKLYIDGFDHTDYSADYDGGAINHAPNTQNSLPSWLGSVGYVWIDKEEKIINAFEGTLEEIFIINNTVNILDLRNIINQSGEIYFQVRTGDNLPLNGNFWGPDGQITSYFREPKSNNLSFLLPSKYLQYIAYITRPITSFNPKLNNISIDYFNNLSNKNEGLQIALPTEQNATTASQRNIAKEKEALNLFYKFFKTVPASEADWQFVNLIAYNQNYYRVLSKEQNALTGFVNYYHRLPKSDLDWGIIRALAYCDKGNLLLKTWLNLK